MYLITKHKTTKSFKCDVCERRYTNKKKYVKIRESNLPYVIVCSRKCANVYILDNLLY